MALQGFGEEKLMGGCHFQKPSTYFDLYQNEFEVVELALFSHFVCSFVTEHAFSHFHKIYRCEVSEPEHKLN